MRCPDEQMEAARELVRTALHASEHGYGEGDAAVIRMAASAQMLEALQRIASRTTDVVPPFRAMGAEQMGDLARRALAAATLTREPA